MTAGWLLITKRAAQQLSWERLGLKWVSNLQKMLLVLDRRSEWVQNILHSLKHLQNNKKINLLYQADLSTSNRLNPGLSSLMISLKQNIYLLLIMSPPPTRAWWWRAQLTQALESWTSAECIDFRWSTQGHYSQVPPHNHLHLEGTSRTLCFGMI